MNTWGIDVATVDATKMIKALHDLKTTEHVESMGAYHNIPEYTQVHITTTWDQDQLDDWLYKTNHGCDYVDTFEVRYI